MQPPGTVAGLTPEQVHRTAKNSVDRREWVPGLERITEEEAARAALFKKQDTALIRLRNKKTYLDQPRYSRIPPLCNFDGTCAVLPTG